MSKILTVAIPCYNSEAYMEHCIRSLLPAGEDIEILIVDDGSTKDRTPQIADEYQEKYPGIIRAIHQENGGHGEAVNAGLRNASGLYYKVIDSDDWADTKALKAIVARLKELEEAGTPVEEGSDPTIDVVVSKGYPIMPEITNFPQKKAEEKLDEAGIAQYTIRIVENNTEFAAGCVVMCTGENGVRIEAGMPVDPSVIIDVWIAGERDDTAQVDSTSGSSSSAASSDSTASSGGQ